MGGWGLFVFCQPAGTILYQPVYLGKHMPRVSTACHKKIISSISESTRSYIACVPCVWCTRTLQGVGPTVLLHTMHTWSSCHHSYVSACSTDLLWPYSPPLPDTGGIHSEKLSPLLLRSPPCTASQAITNPQKALPAVLLASFPLPQSLAASGAGDLCQDGEQNGACKHVMFTSPFLNEHSEQGFY